MLTDMDYICIYIMHMILQMNPSFSHPYVPNTTSLSNVTIGLIEEGCPTGTVPIRRVSKEKQPSAKISFGEQFPNYTTQILDDQPKLMVGFTNLA